MDADRIVVPFAGSEVATVAPAGATVAYARAGAPEAPLPADSGAQDVLSAVLEDEQTHRAFASILSPPRGLHTVIIVNDATRPTPTAAVLTALRARGLLRVPKSSAHSSALRLLIATGSHAAGDEDDLAQILGPDNVADLRAITQWHDARDHANLIYLGETRRGTPVSIHRAVVEAWGMVLINSVEPHYFAGFTGGRKSLVPGVAGLATIEANHRLALEPAADLLALAGNPVHEDLVEACRLVRPDRLLSLQLVLDHSQRIAAAFAGSLEETFLAAVEAARRIFVVELPHRFDIVITAAAAPMDYDLYQSQKALENASRAVKPGGVIILVSSCRHGIGDRTFFDLLACSPHPDEVLRRVRHTYRLGYHKAARLATLASRFSLMAVTQLPPETATQALLQPYSSLEQALGAAVTKTGPHPSILVVPDGCVTVPSVKEAP